MSGLGATVLTVVAAVGTGAVGGVFLAFSTFVMHGLGRVTPRAGAEAMQGINLSAVRPVFMTTLFGTAAACAALVVAGLVGAGGPAAPWWIAGGVLYVVGVVVVTVAGNVPLNNALGAVNAEAAVANGTWERYLRRWTALNHVRTVTALAASALFVLAPG